MSMPLNAAMQVPSAAARFAFEMTNAGRARLVHTVPSVNVREARASFHSAVYFSISAIVYRHARMQP